MALSQTFNEDANGNIGVVGTVNVEGGNTNAVKVDGSGVTQPVSGSVSVSGTVLVDGSAHTQPVSGTVTANAGTGTFLVDGSAHTQPISASSLPLPTGAATAAKQPALGTAGSASADVITVQGVSGMTPIEVSAAAASSSSLSSVSASASSVSILGSNAARKGFMLYNDSNSACYVAFGATASTSAFTVKIQKQGYYESASPNYTGAISAIWDSASGAMRVTSLS
jgi:hypothetical protein